MSHNHSLPAQWNRRRLLRLGITGLILPIAVSQLTHCQRQNLRAMRTSKPVNPANSGLLRSRPSQPSETGTAGLHPLKLEGQRDGVLYVPTSYRGDRPASLILMLHGAGGDAEGALQNNRLVVLA